MTPGARWMLLTVPMLVCGCAGVSSKAMVGASAPVIPILQGSPSCEHARLGSVDAEVGRKVREDVRGRSVPTTNYAIAFQELAEAAKAKGGDAVVLRRHQAVFFTRMGERSREPVYISAHGAVIDMQHADQCELALADAGVLQRRAGGGEAADVKSREAYGD